MSYKLCNPLPAAGLRHAMSRRVDLHMIDVRTPAEFAGAHIRGSHNVPLGQLGMHAEALAGLSAPIVLVCRSGARAHAAERMLREAGARSVHVLDGGVLAWRDAGHSVQKQEGPEGGFLRRTASLLGMGQPYDCTATVEALLATERPTP